MRALLALLLLAALAPLASAQGAACNPAEATLTLEPGQGCHQAPHTLKKGDAIVYSWQVTSPAGARLNFSTHIHIGNDIIPITQGFYTSTNGSLVADRDGLYSLLWTNDGNDTVVYHYTYHVQYPSKTPSPAALGVLALAGAAWLRRR